MQYKELENEMRYLDRQKELYFENYKEFLIEEEEDQGKEKEPLPWYIGEALSDNTDVEQEDPEEVAQQIRNEQNQQSKVNSRNISSRNISRSSDYKTVTEEEF